jgi:hypothetical protein
LLLFGISTPLALADQLINTLGPYTWTDSCGEQMQITVTIYNNVAGFPGPDSDLDVTLPLFSQGARHPRSLKV